MRQRRRSGGTRRRRLQSTNRRRHCGALDRAPTPSPANGCRTAALTASSGSARSPRSTRATSASSASRGTATWRQPRAGVDAALRRRRAVRDDGVEQRQSVRRAHRHAALELRRARCPREWGSRACCDVVNRGARRVERQGLRRHDRRPPARARRGDGRARLGSRHARAARHRLHDHGRAARRERQGHHRQRRRRVRRARLRLGVRRRDRARSRGASSRCPAIRRSASRTSRWPRPRRPGTANGGGSAAAAPCGIRWPTTPSSISSISARATARRGIAGCAAPAAATICSCRRSSRCDPDDGSYVWHYQTTPGESWDYTATQPIVVADLTLDGAPRRVVMQAPKNGFFYVLDAATGQLLSADKFAAVNWASGVDLATGRPIENPAARYDDTGRPVAAATVVGRRAQLAPDGVQPADRPRVSLRERQRARLRAGSQLQSESARLEPRHRSLGGRDARPERARRLAARLVHARVGSRRETRSLARRRAVRRHARDRRRARVPRVEQQARRLCRGRRPRAVVVAGRAHGHRRGADQLRARRRAARRRRRRARDRQLLRAELLAAARVSPRREHVQLPPATSSSRRRR